MSEIVYTSNTHEIRYVLSITDVLRTNEYRECRVFASHSFQILLYISLDDIRHEASDRQSTNSGNCIDMMGH
jgi:hypothetical protein